MMRTLITGATGFVGQYAMQAMPGAIAIESGGAVELRDKSSIANALVGKKFDSVLHLAAQSLVPRAMADPRETCEVNFIGTLNLFECLKESGFSGRVLCVSSAEVYGLVDESKLPIKEEEQLRPRNPYAASKAAVEALCHHWNDSGAFEIIIARPFNHIGPGQSPSFFVSDMARQLAEMKLGRRAKQLEVGDIEVTRDFTDVRDVVCAYKALLEKGKKGEVYNLCSGNEIRLKDVIGGLKKISGVDFEIKVVEERVRRSEQKRVVGSYAKLKQATGWQPEAPMEKSLADIFDFWRKELQ